MSDEWLKPLLGRANELVDENKKELNYEQAKHKVRVMIGQQQLALEDLKFQTVKEVHTDYNGFTIITENGRFVHVTAEAGYEGCVNLCTDSLLEIEDAYNYEILPKEAYDEYKALELAYYKRNNDRNARSRLQNAVADLGPEEAQKFFDELKARQDAANADSD